MNLFIAIPRFPLEANKPSKRSTITSRLGAAVNSLSSFSHREETWHCGADLQRREKLKEEEDEKKKENEEERSWGQMKLKSGRKRREERKKEETGRDKSGRFLCLLAAAAVGVLRSSVRRCCQRGRTEPSPLCEKEKGEGSRKNERVVTVVEGETNEQLLAFFVFSLHRWKRRTPQERATVN